MFLDLIGLFEFWFTMLAHSESIMHKDWSQQRKTKEEVLPTCWLEADLLAPEVNFWIIIIIILIIMCIMSYIGQICFHDLFYRNIYSTKVFQQHISNRYYLWTVLPSRINYNHHNCYQHNSEDDFNVSGIFSLFVKRWWCGAGAFSEHKKTSFLVESSIDTFIGSGGGYMEKLSPLIHKKCSQTSLCQRLSRHFQLCKKI